jgi:twitching motility protein PilI
MDGPVAVSTVTIAARGALELAGYNLTLSSFTNAGNFLFNGTEAVSTSPWCLAGSTVTYAANAGTEQLDAPGLWRGVGFRIGSKRLASGFDEVVEIMPMPQVTPVPGAQPWLLGVANIRGNLLPIVDLKQFLEGERTVLHEGQRVLIVRQPGGDVAVTIDELFGQRSFNQSQQQADETLAQSVLAEGRYAHFIDRAYELADQSWGIFSLERLARTPEFRQAAA